MMKNGTPGYEPVRLVGSRIDGRTDYRLVNTGDCRCRCCQRLLEAGSSSYWMNADGPLCAECFAYLGGDPGVFSLRRLAHLEDVPPDVCEPRAALSGAAILWLCVFALIWLVIGLAIWGWQ